MNKLEHNRLLSDRNPATLSAEINVYDTLTSQNSWSDLLTVAIDKLVEVGKEHMEVFKGEVPVALREPYLKRQGMVLKFAYDGWGNVCWVCYATNTSTTTTQMENDKEGSEEEAEAVDSEEEETPVAQVEVSDGPILVHALPSLKQICPSQASKQDTVILGLVCSTT